MGILDEEERRLAGRRLLLAEHRHHVQQFVDRVELVLEAEALEDRLEQLRGRQSLAAATRQDLGDADAGGQSLAVDDGNRGVLIVVPDEGTDERRLAGQMGPLEQTEASVVLQGLLEKLVRLLLARIADEDQWLPPGPERLFLQAGCT